MLSLNCLKLQCRNHETELKQLYLCFVLELRAIFRSEKSDMHQRIGLCFARLFTFISAKGFRNRFLDEL